MNRRSRSRSLVLALVSLALAACESAAGGDDEGSVAEVCPETGNPLLPDIARVQPDNALGCESTTWAGELERPAVAWTIELERSDSFSWVVPSSDGVVAITGRDARWVSAAGDLLVQRDIGNNVGWTTVQGDFDGRLAVAGNSRYRVFDANGTEIWLRVLTTSPSLLRDGSDVLLGIFDFSQDEPLLRVQRWALTGALQGEEVALPTFSNAFARDGQGNWAVLQDWIVQTFDAEGTPLGEVMVGGADYPFITQLIGGDAGFYAVGNDVDPFVASIVIEGGAPSLAWTRRYGRPGDVWEQANAVARLPEGGLVIVGSEATVAKVYPESPLAEFTQPFVLALDQQGNELWGERIGAAGSAQGVTVGAAGEVYVVGTAQAGPSNEYGEASMIAWLRRYDP
jgi:hypothetical protein